MHPEHLLRYHPRRFVANQPLVMKSAIGVFVLLSVLAFVWGAQEGQVFTSTSTTTPTSFSPSGDDSSGAGALGVPSVLAGLLLALWCGV